MKEHDGKIWHDCMKAGASPRSAEVDCMKAGTSSRSAEIGCMKAEAPPRSGESLVRLTVGKRRLRRDPVNLPKVGGKLLNDRPLQFFRKEVLFSRKKESFFAKKSRQVLVADGALVARSWCAEDMLRCTHPRLDPPRPVRASLARGCRSALDARLASPLRLPIHDSPSRADAAALRMCAISRVEPAPC